MYSKITITSPTLKPTVQVKIFQHGAQFETPLMILSYFKDIYPEYKDAALCVEKTVKTINLTTMRHEFMDYLSVSEVGSATYQAAGEILAILTQVEDGNMRVAIINDLITDVGTLLGMGCVQYDLTLTAYLNGKWAVYLYALSELTYIFSRAKRKSAVRA